MRVRSFFSVKRGIFIGKIVLQAHLKPVIPIITAVREEIPKCMPEERLR